MIDDEYGAVGGMSIGRGNRSTLCPPQISHDLTWDRTGAAAVGIQRLTARDMPRPKLWISPHLFHSCTFHRMYEYWTVVLLHIQVFSLRRAGCSIFGSYRVRVFDSAIQYADWNISIPSRDCKENTSKICYDIENFIFWYITPCSPLKISRGFGGTCHLHLQGRRITQ
jgi:hypothetical protein